MRLAACLTLAAAFAVPSVAFSDEPPPVGTGLDSRSSGQSPEVVEAQGQAPRTGEAVAEGSPPPPTSYEDERAREEERQRLRELQHEDDRGRRRRHRRHRDDDDDSDARSFDLFWGGPQIGLAFIDLKMIEYDDLLPQQVDVSDSGLGFGATIGIKVKILSVGLHLAVGNFTDFDVWVMDLDGQIRIPLGPVEPYLRLALGYAFLGSFQGPVDLGGVDVDGWNVLGGFGLDIYPSDYFSLGAGADFAVLNLTRSGGLTEVDLTQDGGAVGLAIWLQARAAVHF